MANGNKEAPISGASENIRSEYQHNAGRIKSAKLMAALAVPFLGREAGLLRQEVGVQLDPVAGQMLSTTFLTVTSVFVPVQAILALLSPDDENAGVTEIIRRKIKDKTPLDTLELESEISKRLGLVPRTIAGQNKITNFVRVAHNVGVNHLRRRRYVYADTVEHDNMAVTPAIISRTILDQFNGALDPDEHANGRVGLNMSGDAPLSGAAPVLGITFPSSPGAAYPAEIIGTGSGGNRRVRIQAGTAGAGAIDFANPSGSGSEADSMKIRADLSQVVADMTGVSGGGFSLTDLYNAQKADQLIRRMRQVADASPEEAEEAVLDWVFGLRADTDKHPYVLYENRISLDDVRRSATDQTGVLDETLVTYQHNTISFQVPVPATELGGIVLTYLQVTPDEVVDQQPHPILSEGWTAVNHAAEQMRLDPEPVTFRELQADIATASEETGIKFYSGANALKRAYSHYGFNRQTDMDTVDAKTVIWQYAIPAGVTPSNILYPENFSQYPFLDQLAEVVQFSAKSTATIRTPMFFGPTPVEKLAIVDDNDLLGEEE